MTAAQIAELIRSHGAVFSTINAFAPYYGPPEQVEGRILRLDETEVDGPIEVDPENQICIASAGATVDLLQSRLAEEGLCLPFRDEPPWVGNEGRLTLRQAIDLNLPHLAEAEYGNWRDWVIGMTVVLGDGTIAKSGSRAVKNVAGYDAHKLFIGARGSLGIVAEVILRVRPLSARVPGASVAGDSPAIQRILPTDYANAVQNAGGRVVLADEGTSTIWMEDSAGVRRFPHDWLLRPNTAPELDPTAMTFLRRAKRLLDPEGKLNPGLLGCFRV